MVLDWYTIVEALWLILPAYAVNGLMPLAKGKRPIDFNRKFRGNPIFGAGKTWEGLVVGLIVGVIIAFVELTAYPYLPWYLALRPLEIVPMTTSLGFLLGMGAVIGDMAGAFIKRRLGMPRGSPAPVLDQDDFVLGALAFASFLIAIQLEWVVVLVVITPLFHLIANRIAYWTRVKKEPY